MIQGQPSVYDAPTTFRDIYEILRLPILLALLAIAGTWAVWYFTSAACSDELSRATGCNTSAVARYISLDALNKIMTHVVIAGGGGGIWSYAMITRERKAREAAERARLELEQQLAEERERAAEERERAAEERKQLLATIETLSERLAEGRNGERETSSE